jgi:hypothetical protein
LALALVGLVASPALAGLTPSDYLSPKAANLAGAGHTVGVWDGGTGIYTDVIVPANASDVFTVEFAFHWPYSLSVIMIQLQTGIAWDANELQITGIGPSAGFNWGAANYAGATSFFSQLTPSSQNTSGIVGVNGMWQNPGGGLAGSTTIAGSQVIPFLAVQFHVINPIDDGYLDFFVNSAKALWWYTSLTGTGNTYATGGHINDVSYGVAVTPEPASLSLLAGGILAIGAGIWRRRR